MTTQISNGSGYSTNCVVLGITLVVRLFNRVCPLAIGWFVTLFVINSVDGVQFGRASSHVSEEVGVILPSFSNRNATPAVLVESLEFFIATPSEHSSPYSVFPAVLFSTPGGSMLHVADTRPQRGKDCFLSAHAIRDSHVDGVKRDGAKLFVEFSDGAGDAIYGRVFLAGRLLFSARHPTDVAGLEDAGAVNQLQNVIGGTFPNVGMELLEGVSPQFTAGFLAIDVFPVVINAVGFSSTAGVAVFGQHLGESFGTLAATGLGVVGGELAILHDDFVATIAAAEASSDFSAVGECFRFGVAYDLELAKLSSSDIDGCRHNDSCFIVVSVAGIRHQPILAAPFIPPNAFPSNVKTPSICPARLVASMAASGLLVGSMPPIFGGFDA